MISQLTELTSLLFVRVSCKDQRISKTPRLSSPAQGLDVPV